MHLTPSDPDIATLHRKIRQGRLDLQPNFQRGEVWGKAKKQRLIDSILRGWHIPPIHVIQVPNSDKQEVLDGQQRLAAIRDFLAGEYPINGNLDPVEKYIMELDGLSWDELPDEVAGKIEDFTIRLLTISDYKPGEPGELFYRLNQPTNLTSAEQRNAYFGEARQQVKDLSERMVELGYNREILGFSNSRMAYDDVISKFLLTLELGTLRKKITANSVTARYRDSDGFDSKLILAAEECLIKLFTCLTQFDTPAKLNKASALSWLVFIYRFSNSFSSDEDLKEFFIRFESIKREISESSELTVLPKGINSGVVKKLLDVYLDRVGSRVADTSSVVLRDISLWSIFTAYFPSVIEKNTEYSSLLGSIHHLATLPPATITEKKFEEIAGSLDWGQAL
ncbi:DUF262 domain-containing protein [Pseudoalteromonas maricaloris]|uniref:DUF262 domain-containing protein n=1 Tax=Pseudoalteromonas maricaloris TaxID=184924 RepID=A0A8I2H9W5_9GAMM|nr:DUF262 domain-containing protein [Pseudoalteromonas maricaloris]NLR22816.1 DUF262 domain-containing protein [Pseudoalteromonas maricaloris]WOX27729.1 DUF262 domain-containing protein [Pseudoalteromonas maricaloris]